MCTMMKITETLIIQDDTLKIYTTKKLIKTTILKSG